MFRVARSLWMYRLVARYSIPLQI
uniref:Uncharacterized protein n=1 Tax=Anguilla anguilla TaxID=7936 RepID=A0A0E9X9V6_ANGAN